MRGSATLTTVESMNATSDPRIADASVSRFCATVTDRQPNLREDLSGPDADLSLHCHLKGLRLQRLPVTTLLLIPLDDTVVFPTMDVTLPVDVGDADRVVLVPRHDGNFAKVGTIARVADVVRLPGGIRGAALEGESRGVLGAAAADGNHLRIEVAEHPDDVPVDGRTRGLEREYRAVVDEILDLRGDDGRIASFLRSITEPGALADTSGYSPDLTFEQKVQLLETTDVTDRLALALEMQRERLTQLQVRRKIRDDVEDGAQRQQREYFLRKQMEAI